MKRFKNQQELMTAFFNGAREGKTGKLKIEDDIVIHDSFRAPPSPAAKRIIINGESRYLINSYFRGVQNQNNKKAITLAKDKGIHVFPPRYSVDIPQILAGEGNKLLNYNYNVSRLFLRKEELKTFSLRKIFNWACRERNLYLRKEKLDAHNHDMSTAMGVLVGACASVNGIDRFDALARGFGVPVNSPQYWASVNMSPVNIKFISFLVASRHDIEELRLRVKDYSCEAILKSIDRLATFTTMYRMIKGGQS